MEVRGQLAGLGSLLCRVAQGSRLRLSGFGGRHFYLLVSAWISLSPFVDVAWCFVFLPRSTAVFVFSG